MTQRNGAREAIGRQRGSREVGDVACRLHNTHDYHPHVVEWGCPQKGEQGGASEREVEVHNAKSGQGCEESGVAGPHFARKTNGKQQPRE